MDTLSERLRYALKKTGISQTELARSIGVKPQAIQYLCSSNAKKSKFTYDIADALGINSNWLGNGEGTFKGEEKGNELELPKHRQIPLLNWNNVMPYLEGKISSSDSATEWLLTSSPISSNGFALRLMDQTMFPRFEQGCIIFIDPISPDSVRDMDFVLVYVEQIGDIILRQYRIDNNEVTLRPLNSVLHKTIPMKNQDKLLGRVVEARYQMNLA